MIICSDRRSKGHLACLGMQNVVGVAELPYHRGKMMKLSN
jgi:hypothetical protein